MKLDNFPKILWINLERSKDRKERMKKLLAGKINIRIEGIDGNIETELNKICIKNKYLSNVENACTCSHLTAIKYFLETINDDNIIIFEDDVSFEFLDLIPYNWSELEKHFPEDYSVIQLSITYDNTIKPYLVKRILPYSSAVAYLITKKKAKQIIDKYFNYDLNKFDLSKKLKEYAVADSIVYDSDMNDAKEYDPNIYDPNTYDPNVYSIPIFIYTGIDSTIHENHLKYHTDNKIMQLNMWNEKNINYFKIY